MLWVGLVHVEACQDPHVCYIPPDLLTQTRPGPFLSLWAGQSNSQLTGWQHTHSHPGTNIHRITEGVTTDHFSNGGGKWDEGCQEGPRPPSQTWQWKEDKSCQERWWWRTASQARKREAKRQHKSEGKGETKRQRGQRDSEKGKRWLYQIFLQLLTL